MENNNNTQKISISDKIKHIEDDVLNMDKSDDTAERSGASETKTYTSSTTRTDPQTKASPRYYYIAAAGLPILIAGLLYTIRPKFVSKKCKGGKTKIALSKLIKWTVGMTILLWMGLYGYMRYKQLV